MAARSGPAAPGSKEIPEGAEDCLTVYQISPNLTSRV